MPRGGFMYNIEKSGTKFEIANFPWDKTGYTPKAIVTVGYDEGGFKVHFDAYETNLLMNHTEHNTFVCMDSCVEFFMQYVPEITEDYINIEINPIGTAYCAQTRGPDAVKFIPPELIETLNIKAQIFDDHWEVDYYISESFIQYIFPEYKHKEGNILKGNFYKCSDTKEIRHYGCFNRIGTENPNMHATEYFAEFKLV